MRKNRPVEIAVIIPAFNEQTRLAKVLHELSGNNVNVIVVDDGSSDQTSIVAIKNGAIVLKHKVNQGKSKGAALKTGCEYAFNHLKADAVIFMDGDGQHLPADITKFIDKINDGYDVIIGVRTYNLGIPLVRFLGNKLASVLINILFHIYVSDLLCGFRALTRKGYKQIEWNSIGYGVETEMIVNLSKSKLMWCEVPVTVLYHDKMKGVSLLDSFGILFDVIKWRIIK